MATRLAATVTVALLLLAASCHDGSDEVSSSTSGTTDSSSAPTQPKVFGTRTFEVRGVWFRDNGALLVGLHPDSRQVRVRVVPASAVELCPASLDGRIGAVGTPWRGFGFASCKQPDSSGVATLPPTNGYSHVVFALKASGSSRRIDVSVSYSAADSFVMVTPPRGTGLDVTFTPRTASVGAHAFVVPGFGPATSAKIVVSQAGVSASAIAGDCNFASEIECTAKVAPNAATVVRMTAPSGADSTVALYVAWA
ncbi:MAG: hypothetical protein M3Q30_27845 [Actinomycetota bacterium]|nr:hypothetical protein [Actinomycetota bacterium]